VPNVSWCNAVINFDPSVDLRLTAYGANTYPADVNYDPRLNDYVWPTGSILGDDFYVYA